MQMFSFLLLVCQVLKITKNVQLKMHLEAISMT